MSFDMCTVYSFVHFGHCFWPVSFQELLLHRNMYGIRMNQELFSFYSTSAIFLKRCTSALAHQKVNCVGTGIHEQFPMELFADLLNCISATVLGAKQGINKASHCRCSAEELHAWLAKAEETQMLGSLSWD